MRVIECVPNVSEGRRRDVIDAIADAVRRRIGARLLDYSSDVSYNRSVFTIAGDANGVEQAVTAIYDRAVTVIDLRTHRGVHPRIGAVDVVPFVPIDGITMAECAALPRQAGAASAERFQIPIYLHEEAAAHPTRRNLEDIRRGEFEGLARKMASEGWAPDFGPAVPHPTARRVGGRRADALIAYNINLATDRLDVAKKIAAAIRHSSGGFQYVKAIGVPLEGTRGIVQVSMNLTNYARTPIVLALAAVQADSELAEIDAALQTPGFRFQASDF